MGKRRFAGSIKGDSDKSQAERFTNESIHAHIRGWDFGVKITGADLGGEDVFRIALTGGSHNDSELVQLGYFSISDLKQEIMIKRI